MSKPTRRSVYKLADTMNIDILEFCGANNCEDIWCYHTARPERKVIFFDDNVKIKEIVYNEADNGEYFTWLHKELKALKNHN